MSTVSTTYSLSDMLNAAGGRSGDPNRRRAIMQAIAFFQTLNWKPDAKAIAFKAACAYHALVGANASVKTSQLANVNIGIANVKDAQGNDTGKPGRWSAEYERVRTGVSAELRELATEAHATDDPAAYIREHCKGYDAKKVEVDGQVYTFSAITPREMTEEESENYADRLASLIA